MLEASTFGELSGLIVEGMDLFFRDLYESSDLSSWLREHSWRVTGDLPQNAWEVDRFDIPFELLRAGSDANTRTRHQ